MSESTAIAPSGIACLNESERHDVLRSAERRRALDVLAQRSVPLDLDALAIAIAARDPETEPRDAESVERLSVVLHHIHLPKLDEVGLVEYDRSERRVELTRTGSDL